MKTPWKPWVVFVCIVTFSIFACDKWDFERAAFIQIITVGVIEVGSNDAFLLGDIDGLRNTEITETGFVLTRNPLDDRQLRLNQPGVVQVVSRTHQDSLISQDQAFAARAASLDALTKYYFRAYARLQGDETAYGVIDTFSTSTLTISIPAASRIEEGCPTLTTVSFNLEGVNATSEGTAGIVWSSSISNMYPTLTTGHILESDANNPASGVEVNLQADCNSSYFVRGYYKSDNLEIYGPVLAFITIKGGLWQKRSPFPGEKRKKPVIFGIQDKGYLGGGSQLNPELKDLWTYREETDSWMFLGDFEGFDLREAKTVVIENKAYIFTGLRSPARCFDLPREVSCTACQCNCVTHGSTSSCLCYNDLIFEFDPMKLSIRSIGRNSNSLIESASFAINKVGYIIGGVSIVRANARCDSKFCSDLVSSFNPVSKAIQDQRPIPAPNIGIGGSGRTKVVGFSISELGYAGLGEDCRQQPLADFYEFDPSSSGSEWKMVTPFPDSGESILGFATGKKGYILIKKKNEDKILWQFDPLVETKGLWQEMPDLPFRHSSDPTDVFLIGNRVYLYSSVDESGNNLWMYVPELE